MRRTEHPRRALKITQPYGKLPCPAVEFASPVQNRKLRGSQICFYSDSLTKNPKGARRLKLGV